MNPLTKLLLKPLGRAARPYVRSVGLLQVSGVYNRSALVWEPGAETVLVLAPHMDDETMGCGGTLALHAQRGATVTVVFLTDGRNGSSKLAQVNGEEHARRQGELIETRKREARRALERLGVTRMICLEAEDGALDRCGWATQRLRDILLELRPQLVYLPFYLEEHADHRAASRVLIDAVAGSPLDFQCIGYEVWTPLFPNCLVRIDSTMRAKRGALAEYASQLADADYLHTCVGLNAYRSAALLNARGGYAEAFYATSLSEYRDHYARFQGAK